MRPAKEFRVAREAFVK